MATIQKTEEFESWFTGLSDRMARTRIQVRIDRLAGGNPGQYRNLKGGISELKIDYGPGYRVYYTVRAGITYILLCGGDKDSQDADIARAQAMVEGL